MVVSLYLPLAFPEVNTLPNQASSLETEAEMLGTNVSISSRPSRPVLVSSLPALILHVFHLPTPLKVSLRRNQ